MKFHCRKLAAFFKLYRLDVPILVFLGFFAARFLTGNLAPIVLFQALFTALFPYNFVYALNSITDVIEDSVNKPWRPLPSGVISQKEAVWWLLFLAVASIVGIFILFEGIEIFLSFLTLFFGLIYSLPPFLLKKRGLLANFVTGWGIVHPMFIAGGGELFFFTVSLMLHAIASTSLKDLSDVKGDLRAGRIVKKSSFNVEKSFLFAASFMILSALLLCFTPFRPALFIPISSLCVLTFNYFYKRRSFLLTIYKKIIWTSAFACIAALIYVELF